LYRLPQGASFEPSLSERLGKITKVKSSPSKRGKVISQNPKPGKHLPKGSKVALKVGK
jgi:beta-lactam-binding protein with PASTA domain